MKTHTFINTILVQEWGDEEESVLVGPHHQIVDHSKPIDYKKLNR